MAEKVCTREGCNVVLSKRTRSGRCKKHYRQEKECDKCGKPCHKSASYCEKCGFMARSFAATHFVVCQFGECDIITNAKYNLCTKHFMSYWKCGAPGCSKMLKYSNKWQLCTEHHDMTRKLKNNGVVPAVREPLPLLKKRLNSHIRGAKKQKARVIKISKKPLDI
jgi:hypothetical protein